MGRRVKRVVAAAVLLACVSCKVKDAPRVVFDQKDLEYGQKCGSWVVSPTGFGPLKPGQGLSDARLGKYFRCGEQLVPIDGGHEIHVRRPDVQRIAMKLVFGDKRRIARIECHALGCKGVEGAGVGSDLRELKEKVKGLSCTPVGGEARCTAGNVEYVLPTENGAPPADGSNVAYLVWTPLKEVDDTTENVDWYNMSYGLACAEGKNVSIRDGEGEGAKLADPLYADITGDGKPEAIVPITCGEGKLEVFVYSLIAGAPAQLGSIAGQPAGAQVRIEGTKVVVGDAKYRWSGTSLEEVKE